MILGCPSCSTRFSVADEAFASGGRRLRCGKCKHNWFEEAPGAAEEVMAAASEENSKDDIDAMFGKVASDEGSDDDMPPAGARGGSASRASQNGGGSWVGWTALFSVLVTLAAGLALLSDSVIATWPPAKRLYAMAGLPFTRLGEGLEIRNIEARFEPGPNGSRLIILGNIVNISRHARTVPMVRVVLRDGQDTDLGGWLFQATDLNMMPSETVTFRTVHESPPDAARDAVLGFTEMPIEAAPSQKSAAAQ
jgi:predicted Zn finger-like uncharacterized protein